MSQIALTPSRQLKALLLAATCLAAQSATAAEDSSLPKGAAVTVVKATQSCFADVAEVSGIVVPREETAVRPERPGLKVADVMAEPGDTVTAGQVLARLNLPEGGTVNVQAPVGGVISASTATVGAIASGRGEALFNIIARSEYDLAGTVATEDLAKLSANQPATIHIVGAGDVDGVVRRVAPTVEPNSQLGQVSIAITTPRRLLINTSGRARVQTGESCGLAVPLSAVLYGNAGAVVQVIRHDRVETRRVEVGLMSDGQVEIRQGLNEGDEVAVRAGALLREGDTVRPFSHGTELK